MLELCTVVEMELELASLKAASNRETTDASRHEKASNLTGKNFFLFFFGNTVALQKIVELCMCNISIVNALDVPYRANSIRDQYSINCPRSNI